MAMYSLTWPAVTKWTTEIIQMFWRSDALFYTLTKQLDVLSFFHLTTESLPSAHSSPHTAAPGGWYISAHLRVVHLLMCCVSTMCTVFNSITVWRAANRMRILNVRHVLNPDALLHEHFARKLISSLAPALKTQVFLCVTSIQYLYYD